MTACVQTIVLTCRSGSIPAVMTSLEASLSGRPGFLGCWTTELGSLNEIVLLLESPASELSLPGDTDGVERVDRQDWSLICDTKPAPGVFGTAYEWRCYDIRPGSEADVSALMATALPARSKISPAYLVMMSTSGVSRLVHAWPYDDLADRARKRRQAVESGVWPPKGILPRLGTMKSSILTPAAWSPSR